MEMAEISFNRDDNTIGLQDALKDVFIDSIRLNEKLYNAFSEAYSAYIKKTFFYDKNNNNLVKGFLPESEKILKSTIKNIFDERFREEDFITKLSDTVASYSELARSTSFSQVYQNAHQKHESQSRKCICLKKTSFLLL